MTARLMTAPFRPRLARLPRLSRLGALLSAALLAACAPTRQPTVAEESVRTPMDKVLARLVSRGELDKAMRTADSLSASRESSDREIAAYWKMVAWLYRDEPDSALVVLEAGQGKWTGGLRKVHASLFLGMAREANRNRMAARARHDESAPCAPADKSVQDRLESLQKETGDLRAENARLETEKEKYQKLLKDLETIR
ncbi:MAG TPA: hypothetical protein VJ385_22545 [Fibrobacteria bacterium]|nr:hypothetical protein [Fibrobacteria bacterium]